MRVHLEITPGRAWWTPPRQFIERAIEAFERQLDAPLRRGVRNDVALRALMFRKALS